MHLLSLFLNSSVHFSSYTSWSLITSFGLFSVDHFWLYVVAPGIGAISLFCLLISICCLRWKKRAKTASNASSRSINSPNISLAGSRRAGGGSRTGTLELSSLLPRKSSATRATEYSISSIRFLEELGEGAFGKVYRGELVMPQGAVIPIAIKTLKEDATNRTRSDFQREADLMTDLQHPNIVCLLGVCFRDEPLSMLFEFMSEGDLHEFLISQSPRSDIPVSHNSSHGVHGKKSLDLNDFLHISTQIAAGMEYLSSHHYVHRDLAARNCLVGDHLTVKISDFGLSRDIYASDYYRVQSKSLLPVRWMPPESILYGKFTSESDIWSFGVVLWEVFSYGHQPYYGYSNQEVIEMIRSRHLLPCPEDCPPHIYSLMVETWHELPNKRPSFAELHTRLRNWKAVYSNPSSAIQSNMSGDTQSMISGNSSSQHYNFGRNPRAPTNLPPPPMGPSQQHPNQAPNIIPLSSHYSSQPIKGATPTGQPLHVNIPAPPVGHNFTNMNHHHIQQHFFSNQPTASPQTGTAFILNQHHFAGSSNGKDPQQFTRPNSSAANSNRNGPNGNYRGYH